MSNTVAVKSSLTPARSGKPTSATLKELLESSRNLPRRLNDIGTIHLGLNQIKKKAYDSRKYNKNPQTVNPYTKAHYLLVGSGITVEEIENDLESIDLRHLDSGALGSSALIVPQQSIETYIGSQKDENILSAIEQSLSTSARDFDSYVSKNVSLDWKQRKNDLRQTLAGLVKRSTSQSMQVSTEKRSKSSKDNTENQLTWGNEASRNILSSKFTFKDTKKSADQDITLNPNASYALRQKFELFAQVIYQLNDSRQAGNSYELSTVFADLSKHELSSRSRQVHETWLILRDFCESDSNMIQYQERKFAKGHCATFQNDFEAVSLRKRIVTKSRTYLEKQFLDYINELYLKSEKSSQEKLTSNKVKVQHFLELTLKTKNNEWKVPNLTFINGIPIWAILFYLLRAGCYDEALQLISDNNETFLKIERTFPAYLSSYCHSSERRLSPELQGRLANEFNQYFKHSNKETDPFRYATYKLIGRCDLSRKSLPSITLSIEDWLWLHLSLVREDDVNSTELVNEHYTLTDLQNSILQFGPDSFNGSNNNPMYLQTLIFTGLYESAVQHLFESCEIDAIHFAITLAYYGLLRVPDEAKHPSSVNQLLYVDEDGLRYINYARFVAYYTRTFKISDPRVAVEYLFCICLCDSLQDDLKSKQIDLAQRAIRELVLETREFVMLLGKIDKNGRRIPGVIEQRKKLIYLDNDESYLNRIAEQAAIKADEEGRPFDCILLYQLSEEYDTVISLVNKLLGDFLVFIDLNASVDEILSQEQIKGETNIVKLATRLMKTYNSSPEILSKVSLKRREVCSMLLEMVKIRKEFTQQLPDLVNILKSIGKLDLIPCSATMELESIRRKAQEFNTLEDSIAKNIPNLLVIEMRCISQLVYEISQGFEVSQLQQLINSDIAGAISSSREEKTFQLKQMSRNCMIYAGMVQYKMPREVYATLISLDVNI